MIKNSDKSVACISCSCFNHLAWAHDCSSQITEIICAWEAYTIWPIYYQELALLSLADFSLILKDSYNFY